jgi:hypothetical protein
MAMWEANTQLCEEETGLGAEKKVLEATFELALQNVRLLEEFSDRLGLEPEPATVDEYRVALAEGGGGASLTGFSRGSLKQVAIRRAPKVLT